MGGAGLAREHLDDVQAEAAVDEAWQHADLGMAEELHLREFRRAIAGDQLPRSPPSAPLGQLDHCARSVGEALPALPS